MYDIPESMLDMLEEAMAYPCPKKLLNTELTAEQEALLWQIGHDPVLLDAFSDGYELNEDEVTHHRAALLALVENGILDGLIADIKQEIAAETRRKDTTHE